MKCVRRCFRVLSSSVKLQTAAAIHQSSYVVEAEQQKAKETPPPTITSDLPEPLFPFANIKELPVHVQERLYKLHDKAGFTPNLLRAYAHRPREFRSFVEYYDAITDRADSNLTSEDREMIGVAVSSVNRSTYGVVAHSTLLRCYTGDPMLPDLVATQLDEAAVNERGRAILRIAVAVARGEHVTDDHVTELLRHELDAEDLWDIAAFSSLITLINRMSSFLRITPNREFYQMAGVGEPQLKL